MRGLAVGLGAGLIGVGFVVVIARARARSAGGDLSSSDLEKSASGPSGPLAQEAELPPALESGLAEWVAALAAKPVADPATVAGAALFATQLAQAGFAGAATALRQTIDRATAAGRPDLETSPPSIDDIHEPEPRTELWVNHYLGGWETVPDDIAGTAIREALDHLEVSSDGYIRHKPSEWNTLHAGENASELESLGFPTLAAGLRDLIADAQHLPEQAPS